MLTRPKKGEREERVFHLSEVRVNEETGRITGYAAVFDEEAPMWWGDDEVIRSGAFTRTIEHENSIKAFYGHNTEDPHALIGAKENGSLRLSEDKQGLHVDIDPPDTVGGRDVLELVRSGYVDKMSFGFEVIQEKTTVREDKADLRELLEVKLFEVSIVPFPAYSGTSVTARSADGKVERVAVCGEEFKVCTGCKSDGLAAIHGIGEKGPFVWSEEGRQYHDIECNCGLPNMLCTTEEEARIREAEIWRTIVLDTDGEETRIYIDGEQIETEDDCNDDDPGPVSHSDDHRKRSLDLTALQTRL